MKRLQLLSHLPEHQSLKVSRVSVVPQDTHVVHPHATLALLLEGEYTLWSGATYTLHPGDVLIIPEGMPHYAVSFDGCPEAISVACCTSCLRTTAGGRFVQLFREVSEGASAQRSLSAKAAERLRWLLEAMGDELSESRSWQEQTIEAFLTLISTTLLREGVVKEVGTTGGHSLLSAKALSFVVQHAHRGISLADVAKHVHRSVPHTSTVVKSETGRTVVEWITYARLAAARQFLLQTDESIEAIAARLGFGSASHFHRTFRRYHDLTPARWRNAHRTSSSKRPAPQPPNTQLKRARFLCFAASLPTL